MTDREKVLHELEHQVADADWCDNDWKDNVPIWMLRDALALLREQEPVKPITAREGRNKYWSYYVCPNCNDDLNYGQNYCSECGKAVKWDGVQ